MHMCLWVAQEVQRGSWWNKRRLLEREAFNKQKWSQSWAEKVGGVWRSMVDCLNDRKSVGYEKWQYLEDWHSRSGHTKSLRKNGLAQKLNQTCFVWINGDETWIFSMTWERSASEVNENLESEILKVKSWSYFDHILLCEGLSIS